MGRDAMRVLEEHDQLVEQGREAIQDKDVEAIEGILWSCEEWSSPALSTLQLDAQLKLREHEALCSAARQALASGDKEALKRAAGTGGWVSAQLSRLAQYAQQVFSRLEQLEFLQERGREALQLGQVQALKRFEDLVAAQLSSAPSAVRAATRACAGDLDEEVARLVAEARRLRLSEEARVRDSKHDEVLAQLERLRDLSQAEAAAELARLTGGPGVLEDVDPWAIAEQAVKDLYARRTSLAMPNP